MAFKDNFTKFQELETTDYLLRQVDIENDVEDYLKIYSDDELMKYYVGGTVTSDRNRVVLILKNQIKEFKKARVYSWTITCKKSEIALGRIHLSNFESDNKVANIGYFIRRESWGKGVVSSCILPVVEFGFSILKLERIYTTVHPDNIGSWKALEKNGFIREGLLRHCFNLNSGLTDCYMYSKLSSDQ